MLGKYVKVRVTKPYGSTDENFGFTYDLNVGEVQFKTQNNKGPQLAYIMGINHPVRNFDGRVVAIIKRYNDQGTMWVVAPKSKRFIVNDVKKAIAFAESRYKYSIECLYECSCGAVVYRKINDEIRYLLIKNRHSIHWSFPKGHIEDGETEEETAIREVLEETGLHINIIPNFNSVSEYTIQGKIEKSVKIFLATTEDTTTKIQEEEIEDYIWLNYEDAIKKLRFDNDVRTIQKAYEFLDEGDYLR